MSKICFFILLISISLSMSFPKATKEKRKNFDIKGRKLPTEYGIYNVDNSQKIKIIGDFIKYEVSQKLYVVSTMGIAFNSISVEAEVTGEFIKMETIRAFLEKEGKEEQIDYQENSPKFTINGILFDGDIISLRYTYICYSKDLFAKFIPLVISKNQDQKYGTCKLTFEAEGDITVLGTMNNNLVFDGEKIIYEKECPEGDFIDYVVLTRHAAQWSTNYIFKEINKNNNKEISIPKLGYGGNNHILETKISSLNIDNMNYEIVKQNESHYIIKNDKKDKLNLNLNVNFINSIDNEFIYPFNESLIIDTSTEKTKQKAKEILENDHSKAPDYIKLGKWVKNNMKYDSNLSEKQGGINIDDILLNLSGDYSNYTKLYNSLLFSIGVKAVYVNGYVIQGDTRASEKINFVNHAWTMALIDGKWKALDATWGLFFDKFPISHVFLNYSDVPTQLGTTIEPQINNINFIEFLDRNKLFKLNEKKENEKPIKKEIEKKGEKKENNGLNIAFVIVCILFVISLGINVLNCIKNKKLKEKLKNIEDEENNELI